MKEKIKVASMVRDFGIGGTARQVVTIDKYLDKDIFEHIIVSLDSSDNARANDLAEGKLFVAGNVDEAASIIKTNGVDVLYCHRHGRNEAEYDALARQLSPDICLIELNTFSAKDNGFFDGRCDKHVFVSQTNLLKHLKQNKLEFDFKKQKVVYGLIDHENFQNNLPSSEEIQKYRQANGLDGHFVVGRIARPVMGKWDDQVLLFWQKFSLANPEAKLIIYGVPAERRDILTKIGKPENLIIKEPTLSDKELALFYSIIDVLLHVSPIGECSCGTIAEAMLFGKPIITNSTPFPRQVWGRTHTKDNGQIEQIKNGKNGFIANNPEAMTKAAEKIQADRDLAAKMGQQNRIEVMEKYIAAVGIRTLEKSFIEGVLEKKQQLGQNIIEYYGRLEYFPNENQIKAWFPEYYRRLKERFCPQCRKSLKDRLFLARLNLARKIKTALSRIKL